MITITYTCSDCGKSAKTEVTHHHHRVTYYLPDGWEAGHNRTICRQCRDEIKAELDRKEAQ